MGIAGYLVGFFWLPSGVFLVTFSGVFLVTNGVFLVTNGVFLVTNGVFLVTNGVFLVTRKTPLLRLYKQEKEFLAGNFIVPKKF